MFTVIMTIFYTNIYLFIRACRTTNSVLDVYETYTCYNVFLRCLCLSLSCVIHTFVINNKALQVQQYCTCFGSQKTHCGGSSLAIARVCCACVGCLRACFDVCCRSAHCCVQLGALRWVLFAVIFKRVCRPPRTLSFGQSCNLLHNKSKRTRTAFLFSIPATWHILRRGWRSRHRLHLLNWLLIRMLLTGSSSRDKWTITW